MHRSSRLLAVAASLVFQSLMPGSGTATAAQQLPSGNLPLNVLVGKAEVIYFPNNVSRIAVGDSRVLDYVLISPRQIYLLGKAVGSTNIVIWEASGEARAVDVLVDVDLDPLRESLRTAFPRESDLGVATVGGSIVLSGSISDVLAADHAMSFAEAFVRSLNRQLVTTAQTPDATGEQGGRAPVQLSSISVINMLRIRDPQQVMLEVKVAEVSRTVLKQLGVAASSSGTEGNVTWQVLSQYLGGGSGAISALFKDTGLQVDAEQKNGLVKILAEPTIVAVSGQEGSFLAGGRILIPVTQSTGGGASAITLQEQSFGIGLTFLPTVLDNGRINLKVSPEVSELSKEPVRFGTGVSASTLPAFTTRKVSTTVQLRGGQSLVIGGLLRNNLTETIRKFPVLGDLPVLGALFRSSQFANDQTELLVVVSPTLVKATDDSPALPTDNVVPPSQAGFFIEGKLEK